MMSTGLTRLKTTRHRALEVHDCGLLSDCAIDLHRPYPLSVEDNKDGGERSDVTPSSLYEIYKP